MAKMIPARFHEETPRSERRVFDRLQLDPNTEDWTVLHSLGLSRRGHRPFGEIDFVVLVPGAGVACLEVKGGRLRCQGGVWYTRNREGRESALSRSPIAQAREGAFGLRDAVNRKFGSGSDVAQLLFTALAVFPDVTNPPQAPEYEEWEVIDVEDLRGPISRAVSAALAEEEKRIGRKGASRRATPGALKVLRNFLRPDFDIGMARSTRIRRSEERMVRLTEEQYDVLDLFERNSRCLVEGAAGTGKTMLAMEFARRTGPEVGRILLLSFNRLLGEWIKREATEMLPPDSVLAGSYHSCLRSLILRSPVSDEFLLEERSAKGRPEDLFELIYPLYGKLALEETGERVDLMILDEAQDLLREPVLDVLNDWLVGGLAGGRWVMLGDFNRQALYTESDGEWREKLALYADQFTHSTLKRNCRNTRSIGEETALLSGFQSLPYRLDNEDCLPVDYRYWEDRPHQVRQLKKVLGLLRDDGVPDEEVIVLSPRRFEHSVASDLPTGSVVPLDRNGSAPRGVLFSTVHAFKGLESPIVILCDLERLEEDRARALIYTGMSRARSHLILLPHERLKSVVAAAVDRRLEKDWLT